MLTANQIAHREYLKSATWKDIRQQVLERDNHTCRCGQRGYDVHHKHYRNWGNERLEDLITLCRTCHEQLHAIQRGTRKSKSIGTTAIYNYLTKSQKQELANKFNISIITLNLKICQECSSEICTAAAKMLGYNQWYSQNQKHKGQNISKTKKQIKKEKRLNKSEYLNRQKTEQSIILVAIIINYLNKENKSNFNLNNLILNRLKTMQVAINNKFRIDTDNSQIQIHTKKPIQCSRLKKLDYEDSIRIG